MSRILTLLGILALAGFAWLVTRAFQPDWECLQDAGFESSDVTRHDFLGDHRILVPIGERWTLRGGEIVECR